MRKLLHNLISAAITLSIAVVYIPEPVFAQGGSCTQKILNTCQEGAKDAWNAGDGAPTGGAAPSAGFGASRVGARGLKMGEAAQSCKGMKFRCQSCPQNERKQCESALDSAAGQIEAQSAGMGDASSAMGMIAGLAGALLPLLMKKDEGGDDKKDDSALLPNGQYDCSKNDAYMFPACDALLSASCKNAMEDPRCVAFSNRYCGTAQAGSAQFCGFVAAYGFCRAGGRDQCPSCLQLQGQSQAVCQADPSQCMAQNSPGVIAGTIPATCGGDPILNDPSVAAALGAGGGQNPYGQPIGGSVPPGGGVGAAPPVLPGGGGAAPVVGGGTQPPVGNPGGGGGGGGSIPVLPPIPPPINNGNGGGIGLASIQSATQHPVGAGGRDVANVGPASDVQGQYGPSVFAVSTQVIRSKCTAGKFLNCP